MATQTAGEIQILSGTRCMTDIELAYTCLARVSGAGKISSTLPGSSLFSPQTWVTRGNEFAFDIHFSVSSQNHECQYKALIDELAKALLSTRIWSELDLQASRCKTGRSLISLSLQHIESSIACVGNNGKTAVGYTSKLTPPRGIPSFFLDKVNLHLEIRNRHSEGFISRCSTVSILKPQSIQASPFVDITRLPIRSIASQNSSRQLSGGYLPMTCNQNAAFSSLEDDDELNCHHASRSDTEPRKCALSPRVDTPIPNLNGSTSEPNTRLNTPLQLISSILRTNLLGARDNTSTKPLPARHQSKTATTGTTTLAKLCPTMFSPGYLRAMNERNSLIPSIAHSLLGIYTRSQARGQSESGSQSGPRSGAHEQSPPPASSSSTADTDTAMPMAMTKENIERALWTLAQTRLFNERASWRLPPLIDKQGNEHSNEIDEADAGEQEQGQESTVDADFCNDFCDIQDIPAIDDADGGDEEETEHTLCTVEDFSEIDEDSGNAEFDDDLDFCFDFDFAAGYTGPGKDMFHDEIDMEMEMEMEDFDREPPFASWAAADNIFSDL